jgi:F0F1-type ATP synthase assembly protein I
MEEPNTEKKNKGVNSYIKYSAVGFQMLATIGLFTFIGYKVDEYRKSDQPIFTALISLIGVIISLYQVIKQVNKN